MSDDLSEADDVGTEVTFNVIVLADGGTYGATLYADDGQSDDEDGVPCWRTVFRGKPGADVDAVAEIYADCHQDAMEAVGMDDFMEPDEWLEKMRKSVVVAGELMERYGYRIVPTAEVSGELAMKVFEGLDEWPSSPPVVDLKSLN